MEWCQREGLRQLEWLFKPGTGKDRSSLLWSPGKGLLMCIVFSNLFLLIFLFFVNRKKYANKPQKYANIRKSTQILIFVLRAIWEKRLNLSEPFWFLQLQFQFSTFLGHLGFDWNDWWKRAIVSEARRVLFLPCWKPRSLTVAQQNSQQTPTISLERSVGRITQIHRYWVW